MMLRAAALGLALLGCSTPEPKTYQDEIRGMQFVPAELTVNVGDTIVWTNEDVVPHTATSGVAAPISFDSKELASKQTWQLTVTASGEYAYACTYHPTMTGKLVVR